MQMTNPNQQQYDRGITTFSPDGRLFQVEYAKEAVKKGATALGIVYDGGVVLGATRSTPELQVRNPEKVFKIDDHIGVATSGLVADGRTLVEEARNEAQKHLMTYSEEIPTSSLSKFISDRCQQFTQYGGVRPYGLATIAGGVKDGKAEVYQTDPSGTLSQWNAIAIGKGGSEAREYLQENWEEGLSREEAIELALDALKEGEDDIELKNVEMGTVDEENNFQRLSPGQLEEEGFEL